jgi:hypothetical protein
MAEKDPYEGLPDHVAEAFRSGGSVLVNGETHTSPDTLPEGFDKPKPQPKFRTKIEVEEQKG